MTIGINQQLLKRLHIVYVLYINRFEIRKRNSKDTDAISQDIATKNRILLELLCNVVVRIRMIYESCIIYANRELLLCD
jgi:hypothetical protein